MPRFSSSYWASTYSTAPRVFLRTTFSMTTTSLGCDTAKYGSAVTMRPKACNSVVMFSLLSEPLRRTSPRLVARPSGVIAHIT